MYTLCSKLLLNIVYIIQLHGKRATLHLHCLGVQVESGSNTATCGRNWRQEMQSKQRPCDCELIIVIIGKGKGNVHPRTGHECPEGE